jgi:hypothetical protein
MSDPLDAAVADAWGRRLEGEADAAGEAVLAEALQAGGPAADELAPLLLADERLDRLLRRSLAPPAAAEEFVAGVLAAIDLPLVVVRTHAPRPRPTAGISGGLVAATIAGLGLVAAVIALAVIQPWSWRAAPARPPVPNVADRQPEPEPQPRPPAMPAPAPAPTPPPHSVVEIEPSGPSPQPGPGPAVRPAVWKRGGPSAGVLPLGVHELSSGTATAEAAPGLTLVLEGPTEIEVAAGPRVELRRGRLEAEAGLETAAEIVTPAAAIADLAGRIGLDVARSGETTTTMRSGTASFTNLSSGSRTVLREGQRATAAAGEGGAAESRGAAAGGSSISISEQLINGRFRGTITIDGRTETFESRESFEEAKRKLGR